MHYLVHYAGWNVRYDEWITKDRITSVVELGKPSAVDRQTSKTGTAKSSGKVNDCFALQTVSEFQTKRASLLVHETKRWNCAFRLQLQHQLPPGRSPLLRSRQPLHHRAQRAKTPKRREKQHQ